MASLSLANLVPQAFVEPLRSLGKVDWVRLEQSNSNPPTTSIRMDIPAKIDLGEHSGFVRRMRAVAQLDASAILGLYAQSKLIANGPKILIPTVDQCEALEHVDVTVSFEEYEQPFPVFVVEVPEAYRRDLSDRFGHRCPRFVTTFHDRTSQYIVSLCQHGPDINSTMTVLSPRPQWRHIEDALHLFVDTGPDLAQSEVLNRVAINFGLLLTHFGTKDCGPVDPIAHEKQQLIAKRKHGRKAELARQHIDNTMNLIVCSQNVVFNQRPHVATEATGEGPCKRPHWRRGHFRRQPCGTGRLERRLVFVKPSFIHDEVFLGDRADTNYTIRVPQ